MVTTNVNFAPAIVAYSGYTVGQGGWTNFDEVPRQVADVNGDGRADIVGFAYDPVVVSLGQSNGTFAPMIAAYTNGYTVGQGGWTNFDTYPRQVADVNGDGRADIVGFAADPVVVSLGQSNGTFANATIATNEFTVAQGWTTYNKYPRELADVNGDNRADIVGFSENSVYIALGRANGTFAPATIATNEFSVANTWSTFDIYPRRLADVNGDGKADIVGFGQNNVYVALARITQVSNNPNISINDITLTEGNSGNKQANFTVTLSKSSPQTIRVNYTTLNGSATAPSDYISKAGTITFNPNQTRQTITISVKGDKVFEGNETFSVRLNNASNATIRDGSATATITNDDLPLPKLSINDVRLFEGSSGNKSAKFTVTLTGRTQENVSVLYNTANGTATAGSDFTPLAGTLSFRKSNATTQTETISIPVRGDRTPERDETFFVNLSSAVNAEIRDSRGVGTIRNDDDSRVKFLGNFSQGSPLNVGLAQFFASQPTDA